MRILGKETTTKMLIFCAIMALCAGFASAALVNYVSNSLTATVNVNPAGLVIEAAKGFSADPRLGGLTWAAGSIPLSDITAGGNSEIVNVRINNAAPPIPGAVINVQMDYTDTAGVGDPMNCDAAYAYGGSGTCLGCPAGTGLCISGQELEVVGLRTFNGVIYPDPASTGSQAACESWTDIGGVTGYWYDDGVNQVCFANYKPVLVGAGITPDNPLNLLPPSTTTIPTGAIYAQIVVKTTLDATNKVQIAPGQYDLSVNVQ